MSSEFDLVMTGTEPGTTTTWVDDSTLVTHGPRPEGLLWVGHGSGIGDPWGWSLRRSSRKTTRGYGSSPPLPPTAPLQTPHKTPRGVCVRDGPPVYVQPSPERLTAFRLARVVPLFGKCGVREVLDPGTERRCTGVGSTPSVHSRLGTRTRRRGGLGREQRELSRGRQKGWRQWWWALRCTSDT